MHSLNLCKHTYTQTWHTEDSARNDDMMDCLCQSQSSRDQHGDDKPLYTRPSLALSTNPTMYLSAVLPITQNVRYSVFCYYYKLAGFRTVFWLLSGQKEVCFVVVLHLFLRFFIHAVWKYCTYGWMPVHRAVWHNIKFHWVAAEPCHLLSDIHLRKWHFRFGYWWWLC